MIVIKEAIKNGDLSMFIYVIHIPIIDVIFIINFLQIVYLIFIKLKKLSHKYQILNYSSQRGPSVKLAKILANP